MALLEEKPKQELKNSSMVEEIKEMIDEDPDMFERLSYK